MLSASAAVKVLPPLPAIGLNSARCDSSPQHETSGNSRDYDELPRAASYTTLPTLTDQPSAEGIKRTYSDDVLASKSHDTADADQSVRGPSKGLLRARSKHGKQEVAITQLSVSSEDLASAANHATSSQPQTPPSVDKPRPASGRSVSNTFRSLARRSWKMPSSRSPSPSAPNRQSEAKSRNTSPLRKTSKFSNSTTANNTPAAPIPPLQAGSSSASSKNGLSSASHATGGQGGFSTESPQKQSIHANVSTTDGENDAVFSRRPSLRSLRSRASSDKLPKTSNGKIPPVPSSLSSERSSATSNDSAKKKDPLWNAFRLLEADYQK